MGFHATVFDFPLRAPELGLKKQVPGVMERLDVGLHPAREESSKS